MIPTCCEWLQCLESQKLSLIKRKRINAFLYDTFVWFDHCENYLASPIVFNSRWRKVRCLPDARRDIIMIASWYSEVITQRQPDRLIQYRLPKVRQDFTQISFTPLNENLTRIE
jgi:hypothetical protein